MKSRQDPPAEPPARGEQPYVGPPRLGQEDEPLDPNAFAPQYPQYSAGPPYPPQPYAAPTYQPPYQGPYQPPYGFPPSMTNLRPSTVTSASVLAYVESALLLFVTLFLAAFADDPGTDYSWIGLAAAANVVSAGLLIAGAVLITDRTAAGRILYCAGSAIVGVSAVWWATRWTDGAAQVFAAGMFTILLIIGLAVLWAPESNRWFATK